MGGKADTGLGERDDEDDDEEDDIGHSREFMSWRLRQKAVTCSVLCTGRDKETEQFIFSRICRILWQRRLRLEQSDT